MAHTESYNHFFKIKSSTFKFVYQKLLSTFGFILFSYICFLGHFNTHYEYNQRLSNKLICSILPLLS